MPSTQKIQLEIYSDKIADFYMALFACKVRDDSEVATLRKLADAIKFDKDSFLKFFEPDEAQQQKIRDNLLAVHNYLFKCKKDSEDYFTVSKENFEKFQMSDFGKELSDLMAVIECFRQWSGNEKTAEVKTAAAVMSTFASSLMQGLGRAISKSMSKAVNTAAAIQEAEYEQYKVSTGKKGNLLLQFGEEEPIEMELFIEKNGQFIKTNASSENGIDIGKVNSFFLKAEEQYLQIKPADDGSCEITHYENVKAKNRKLDLSKATVKHKITVPKEQSGIEMIEEADGAITYQHKPIPEEKPSIIQFETTETITLNDISESQKTHRKTVQDEKPKGENPLALFPHFDDFLVQFLKSPQNVPERIDKRDKIILGLYELLKKHFPDITLHSSTTITGFIASRMELLNTEEQHLETKRIQPYRKYLRDSVYNILKSNSLI